MEKLLIFIMSAAFWYLTTSLISWNLYIDEWHWVARLFFISFTFLTYSRTKDIK